MRATFTGAGRVQGDLDRGKDNLKGCESLPEIEATDA
jgi:hypothetical protein